VGDLALGDFALGDFSYWAISPSGQFLMLSTNSTIVLKHNGFSFNCFFVCFHLKPAVFSVWNWQILGSLLLEVSFDDEETDAKSGFNETEV